jgi:hypothetical protein
LKENQPRPEKTFCAMKWVTEILSDILIRLRMGRDFPWTGKFLQFTRFINEKEVIRNPEIIDEFPFRLF